MDNAERFLNAYAAIEKAMNQMCPENRYVPFAQMLERCGRNSRVIRINQETLKEYCELRNAIVHQRGSNQEVIAQPNDSVTADIERIAALLQRNDSILQYASKPVQTVCLQDTIQTAFQRMDALSTSKLPVYDNGRFVGLVTMEEIARWGVSGRPGSGKVSDIIVDKNKNNRVLFLGQKQHVQDAISGFEDAMNHGATLLAILITENGNVTEKPLGIVTVYDLPKILADYS